MREFRGEVAEIAQNGWETGGEEEREDSGDGDDEKNDGDDAGGTIASNADPGDAGDGGRENDSEECADVEDEDLFLKCPGQGEEEKDSDGEEDVTADRGA